MEQLLGQIELFSYEFAPQGWAFCEGQLLSVTDNQALFSLLGTRFGGDGRTNFGLPDLKGKGPVKGLNYCIALTGNYPVRA